VSVCVDNIFTNISITLAVIFIFLLYKLNIVNGGANNDSGKNTCTGCTSVVHTTKSAKVIGRK